CARVGWSWGVPQDLW
nr:immunoglobulin heavy chain junction region [Macaca mulatta]